MSKKAILGTLLASATLLGAASVSHADTSDIKAESKKITITSDNAKLYKDSKLKESTKAKKGAVYQVDGYRNINGKHVYRLYQKDQYDKDQYKGYLVSTDAKDLKSSDAKGQFVAKKGATMWENFYWNNKREVTSQEKVFFAKYSYTLGNGDKYYSMYYKNADGKDTWAGYTNAVNVNPLKAVETSKYVTLKKDYNTWANLYFKEHKTQFTASKGVNFKVKRYYELNGNKFYSTYRTDSNGKEVWTGYVNGYSSVVEDLKADKVEEKDQKVQVVKDYNTYSNHFFNKKGQLSKDKIVTMKVTYTYGNGKKYASLYDGDTWLGYANIDAVKSANELFENAQKAIEDAKEQLKGHTTDSQKAVNEAIAALEEALKSNDVTQINDKENVLKDAVKNLQLVATSADMERLNEAITIADKYVGSADKGTDATELNKAIEAAKKVQEAAKKNNASSSDVDNAVKAIDEAIKAIKPGETSVNKEEIQKLQAAIKLLKDVEKIGADKLENDGNYNTVLKGAEDTLSAAKDGKATQEQIDAAIKSVEDFINGLTLNNSNLDKLIQEIKELGANVYMTKDQEEKFNEFVQQAEEAVKDNKLTNVDKLKEINEQAAQAKKFVEAQPTEKDVQALIDATKKEQALDEYAKEKENDLFDGWSTVTEKDTAADEMLAEIKKDGKESNEATKEYTAQNVKDAAGALNQAMSDLTVNKDNTEKFAKAAQKEIDGLIDNEAAQKALDQFETQLKSDHTINNYEAIISTAKDAVEAIKAAEKTSGELYTNLDDAISKAKPYNNNSIANNPAVTPTAVATEDLKEESKEPKNVKSYYEAGTYDKFISALEEAAKIKKATMSDNKPEEEKTKEAAVQEGQAEETPAYHKDQVEAATKALTDATEGLRFNKTEMTDINEKANEYVHQFVSTLGVVTRAQTAVNDLNTILADDNNMKPTKDNKQKLRDAENMVVVKAEELSGVAKQETADKIKAGLEASKGAYETQRATAGHGDAAKQYVIFDATTNTAFRKAVVDADSTYKRLATEDATKESSLTEALEELKTKGEGLNLNEKALVNAIASANKAAKLPAAAAEVEAEDSQESEEKKALEKAIQEANSFKSTHADYFTKTVTEENAKAVNAEIGKLYDATKAYEESLVQQEVAKKTVISDKATLSNPDKLSRAILAKEDDAFTNMSTAKELAEVVEAATKVDANSTGDESKSIAALDNNRAWTEFGDTRKGTYYDAYKTLQDYAKDVSSVTVETMNRERIDLEEDMEGLRVLTNDLKSAMAAAEQAETQVKVDSEVTKTTDELIEDAKVIVESKTDSRRGIDNWKHINELTAQLKAATQKVKSMFQK